MNVVVISGRLTKDVEARFTQGGKAVSKFTLAVEKRFPKEGEQKANFIDVVAWGKTGENCGNYLIKGQEASVTGELNIRSYEAKDGSGKRWVTEIIADRVEFGRKPKDGAFGATRADDGRMESFGEPVAFDEEIPF